MTKRDQIGSRLAAMIREARGFERIAFRRAMFAQSA
jgi:hypothetical protein